MTAGEYICAECGEIVEFETGILDSGTVLDCPNCNAQTIVDLFSPEARALIYARAMKGLADES